MVVGFDFYERCLSCHACYSKDESGEWERISDTPTNFRIADDGVKKSELRANQTLHGRPVISREEMSESDRPLPPEPEDSDD